MKCLSWFDLYLSDYQRYTGKKGGVKATIDALIVRYPAVTYSFWLRMASRRGILFPIAKFMQLRLSRKYGLEIYPSTKIGRGLYLGHGLSIVINPGTVIGNNCNISHFVSIGTNHNTPATIGDNVYIGPNVCIVEDVHIGNNVIIGAGAVVVKDIPDNVTVAGVPACIINYHNSGKDIGNSCEV